jgi:hypothetical protein
MSWRQQRTYGGAYQVFLSEVCDIVMASQLPNNRSNILGQQDLCERVGCSPSKLCAAMPDIVEQSTRQYPGHCLQVGWGHKTTDGRRVKFYRIVDQQNMAEFRTSRGRFKNGMTRIERARSEINVERARPAAKAACTLMDAGLDLQERALRELETVESEPA